MQPKQFSSIKQLTKLTAFTVAMVDCIILLLVRFIPEVAPLEHETLQWKNG